MSWFHLIAAAAAGTLPTTAAFDQATIDPHVEEEIALRSDWTDRLTVPVTINGQGPYRFMIDTGAQATVLSTKLADDLQLNDRKPAILVGMISRMPIEVAEVPQFSLGTRTFNIRNAPLVDRANIGADGIVGLDSLQGQRVTLDFGKNRMLVADARDSGGNRGYEIIVRARPRLGQLIITSARLNDIPVQVLIDTGAQGSIGNQALHERLARARELGPMVMTDINGETLQTNSKQGRSLTFGTIELSNLQITFAETPTFEALDLHDEPALILGISELRLFERVAIDFEERKILFDLPRNVRSSDLWTETIRGM